MIGQHLHVPVAQRVQRARRTLDIREQQRHGARRKVAADAHCATLDDGRARAEASPPRASPAAWTHPQPPRELAQSRAVRILSRDGLGAAPPRKLGIQGRSNEIPKNPCFGGSRPVAPFATPGERPAFSRFAPRSTACYEPALHDLCTRGPNRGPTCPDVRMVERCASSSTSSGVTGSSPVSPIPVASQKDLHISVF